MTFLLTISPQSVRYSPSIRPHHPLLLVVQREAVGPGDAILNDHATVAAVHPDPPNVGVFTPVGPVQVPERDKKHHEHSDYRGSGTIEP